MSSSEYGQNANRSQDSHKQVKRIEKEVHMIDQLTRPWEPLYHHQAASVHYVFLTELRLHYVEWRYILD